MTTWIATFSSDVSQDAPIKELYIEAGSESDALGVLENFHYDETWQHYSLDNVRRRRGGKRPGSGRPKGIARAGRYGSGVKTRPVRVPVEIAGKLPEMLESLEELRELLNDWEKMANSGKAATSPRYDQARKLIGEIRSFGF